MLDEVGWWTFLAIRLEFNQFRKNLKETFSCLLVFPLKASLKFILPCWQFSLKKSLQKSEWTTARSHNGKWYTIKWNFLFFFHFPLNCKKIMVFELLIMELHYIIVWFKKCTGIFNWGFSDISVAFSPSSLVFTNDLFLKTGALLGGQKFNTIHI
jgi:hypothetical protein